jgi:hypothetical protein
MTISAIIRRGLLSVLVSGVAASTAPAPLLAGDAIKVVVHRSATCGCCKAWSEHLRRAGFTVNVIDEADMRGVKERLGVPQELASCHTAEVDGYVIEGHVPVASIKRLLAEKPKAFGLSTPGMPAGSPGMEGPGESDVYDVLLFDHIGERTYGKYQGDRPM